MKRQPYGANVEMEKWSKATGYRYVPHSNCLHWISGIRCRDKVLGICRECYGTHRWMDHTSAWEKKDGERLLLCQPYECPDRSELQAACNKFGLVAYIHKLGWYGHGTFCIELKKAAHDPAQS